MSTFCFTISLQCLAGRINESNNYENLFNVSNTKFFLQNQKTSHRTVISLQFLRDNRRNLLSSAEKSFTNPPSYDQDTAKLEIKTKLDAEAKGGNISPDQSKTFSPSSRSKTPSPSMPSSKSDNTRKEPLPVVSKRIQSLIKRLDVPAWLQKVASHEKPRKVSTKTETPDLQNDQKQSNAVKETSGIAQESEGLERPRERYRRNSDSCLYCKARDETIARSVGAAETEHQESEKYEFVQRYLQNIEETHSITTETTDSGIRTHGEPSDLEMQDVSGKYHLLISHCLGSQILNNY